MRPIRAGAVVLLACETMVSAGAVFRTVHLLLAAASALTFLEFSGITPCAKFKGILLPLSSGWVGTIATVSPERTKVAVAG